MHLKPKPDQMRVAALWLETNEGQGDEGTSCHVVAEWLIDKADNLDFIAACREAGVPVAKARAAFAKAIKA